MNANSCADCALTSSVNELQLSQPSFQRKKGGDIDIIAEEERQSPAGDHTGAMSFIISAD